MLLTGQDGPIQVFMSPVSNRLMEGDVFDIGSVDSGGGGERSSERGGRRIVHYKYCPELIRERFRGW